MDNNENKLDPRGAQAQPASDTAQPSSGTAQPPSPEQSPAQTPVQSPAQSDAAPAQTDAVSAQTDATSAQPSAQTPAQPEPKKPSARSKRNMLIYAVVFACVVILLITISYFMQLKENRELQGDLNEQITVSQGASENIKKLQAEYEKLSADKADLETRLEEKTIEITKQKETISALEQTITDNEASIKSADDKYALLEKKYFAYSDMTELLRLSRAGDLEGARNSLAIMEQKKERDLLDTMSQSLYDQIKKELASAPQVEATVSDN